MARLAIVHPGAAGAIYQDLSRDYAAIEPPLWARLIAGYCRDRGHEVAIIDAEAQGITPTEAAHQAAGTDPDLIAIPCYGHQPSASTQQMTGARSLLAALAACDVPTIVLGGHVSALPERTLREEAATFACKGEGPATVAALLAAPRGTMHLTPGLVWRNGPKIVVNVPSPLIENLDRDLHGHAWDLLDLSKYRAHNWQCFGELDRRSPYAAIYTSLGCPYRCSFCCINAPFDSNRYRMRSPKLVADEVHMLYAMNGVRTFKIVDEMFVLNERHVRGVCEAIINKGIGDDLNIWAYARVDTVRNRAQLDLLRAAGFKWLALGIESGSKHVRDGAEKALRHDDIERIVREIQAAGINVIGNYIFGLPDDTEDTMRETLDLALSLRCEFANFYSAMAYPGSALYAQALREGWRLPTAWSGYSQHSRDCTPLPTATLTSEEVLAFRDQAFHRYFTDPGYLRMVRHKFGLGTAAHVADMAARRLPRALLDEQEPRPVAIEGEGHLEQVG